MFALNVKVGGSGRGVSWAKKVHSDCPNAVALSAGEERESALVAGASGIGTLFHAMQARYYTKGGFDPYRSVVPEAYDGSIVVDDEAMNEAARLHCVWQRDHSPDEFGEVVGVEVAGEHTFLPGLLPNTADLDLVTRKDGREHIYDWKVISDASTIPMYALDPQGLFYQMVRPGALFSYVFIVRGRSKKNGPEVVIHDLPEITEADRDSVSKWFINAARREGEYLTTQSPQKHLHLCSRMMFNRLVTCKFLGKECSR